MIIIDNRIVEYKEGAEGEAVLDQAARIIEVGGVVAFPTDTVYGIGTNVFDIEAVKKIFDIKKRSRNKPLIVCISEASQVDQLATEISKVAKKLIEHFWPGPLTLVLKRSTDVPDIVTGGRETIAVRCPASELARRLIAKAGYPLVATSANLSGQASARSAQEVYSQLDDKVDLIIDGGRSPLLPESTVLDLTTESPAILREGAIPRDQLREIFQQFNK